MLLFCYPIWLLQEKALPLHPVTNQILDIMAKKKGELSHSERIAALEKRIAEMSSTDSKVKDSKGHTLGSVKLRYKSLADGRISFYLDIYTDGKRRYEFLNVHIDPAQVVSAKDVGTANENAILEATSKRAAVAEDMQAGKDVAKKTSARSKMLLKDWIKDYSEQKKKTGQSDSFSRTIDKTLLWLIAYRGENVTLREIDKEYCEGFLDFLDTTPIKGGKHLAKVTQAQYYKTFSMAIDEAVRRQVVESNPVRKVDKRLKPRVPESDRAFLDVDEIKALIATPCTSEATKRAYLFCCFCGLRHSDLEALTWGDIVTRGGHQRIEIKMIKTGKPLSVPLSDEALRWMPSRGEAKDTDRIFTLHSLDYTNRLLRRWAEDAGITKHLSFHTSRHTFATLELTAGADLYTTSKLLGHTNVKVTQVYAKIIDRKKDEAVSLVSSLFND